LTGPWARLLAVLLALLGLVPGASAADVPQPLFTPADAVPVVRPGPVDPARQMPLEPFLRAESDFAAGKADEALREFLDLAYSGPDGERKGFVWTRVGELLLARGELDKALEAADRAVILSRARYFALAALDLKLRIYQRMQWTDEARQMAGYLLDQKFVDADVPALLTLMARADAAAGKVEGALALYRRAVAESREPADAQRLSSERDALIDRTADLSVLRAAAESETDPDVRSHLFLAIGKIATQKGFLGMATYAFGRSVRTGGHRAREAADYLFRAEQVSSGRPKIVGLVPLSGAYANIGFAVLCGAEVALSPLHRYESANVTPVIRWVDTAGDPEAARREFTAASADGTVIGFLGPLTGEEGRSVSAAFGPKSPPVLYMGQKSILQKPFLYGFGLSPAEEARAVLGRLAKDHLTRILLFQPENGYGRGFADAVAAAAREAGVRIVRTLPYAPQTRDFTELIRKAVGNAKFQRQARSKERGQGIELPFDAIVIADRWERVFLLASQLNYYNVYLPLAGFSGWSSEELLRKGGSAVAGAMFSVDYSDAIPGSQGDRFRKAFQDAMHTAPTRFEAMGYDGALLLSDAFSAGALESGKRFGEAMRERIPRMKDFLGVTGTFQFSPAGDLRRKVSLLRVELGNFVPVPGQ
jgi:branched-chain amino acid transport system substrate-binding protein